ncbi:MAG: preprotein translocase subunit SecE [Candidatus Pacebacteria bacterium]|nr:preprotein translocase subunit SecE [Candidatus Paceibacterota bacterium]PIR63547.1 MAG: preprotein translocase subunit SecE [Candidatus Pacebacteria bacterium CG10_big_fil_rev_8_21_14_0_10_40_26]PIZ79201.1 MAG: preprotein translocase subunit SecE [Candidatus Pacebacteria bacterium CG_4_10_14_0_2_um_filter_40_20]PJA68857.1 MAG: preprotein translocase subunit SecE [Candidatus Pacebacteria bacterium CG_4_9_14_3_um_filter_40_12]PJC42168.1 MAG: preprotein translocase subunit SecE [Candidatus Pac
MFKPAQYFTEVAREIKKVTWPSREQTQEKTVLVLAVSIIIGLYIGVLDFVFSKLLAVLV